MTILYLAILYNLSPQLCAILIPFLVFSDTSVFGFFFIGGIILLERRQRTLNGYFFRAIGYTIIYALPLLDFLGVFESILLRLLPTYGLLALVSAPFQSVTLPEMIGATANLIIWNGLAWWWASAWFRKYVIERIGADL